MSDSFVSDAAYQRDDGVQVATCDRCGTVQPTADLDYHRGSVVWGDPGAAPRWEPGFTACIDTEACSQRQQQGEPE